MSHPSYIWPFVCITTIKYRGIKIPLYASHSALRYRWFADLAFKFAILGGIYIYLYKNILFIVSSIPIIFYSAKYFTWLVGAKIIAEFAAAIAAFNIAFGIFVSISTLIGFRVLRENKLVLLALALMGCSVSSMYVIIMMFVFNTYYDWYLVLAILGFFIVLFAAIWALKKGEKSEWCSWVECKKKNLPVG